MKTTGIIRKLDELGRVVIPMEIRKKLEIEQKDPIEIYLDGNSIILKKYEVGCIFCNSPKDLNRFQDKFICKKCLQKLNNLNQEDN